VHKAIRSLCAALLLASAAACVTFNIPAEYGLSPASGKGLAVFSLTANDRPGNFTIAYRSVGGDAKGDVSLHTLRNPLDWRDPRGRLVVIELPAGSYEFYNWAGLRARSTDRFSIPFSIEPGKATYLGNVHFDVFSGVYGVRVSDRSSRDLPALFERYPNLQRDALRTEITKVQDAEVPAS
jgi:hypothetical protein